MVSFLRIGKVNHCMSCGEWGGLSPRTHTRPPEAGSSGGFPDLVENARSDFGLVLRQEATVVLGHHLRRVLDRVASLLVGAGLLQNVGGQHVAHIVRAMWQKSFDRAATGPRVEDAVTLDDEPPSLIECVLIIRGFGAGYFRCLDEESPGIGCRPDQARAVPVDATSRLRRRGRSPPLRLCRRRRPTFRRSPASSMR